MEMSVDEASRMMTVLIELYRKKVITKSELRMSIENIPHFDSKVVLAA